jgi:hypothetical protein
MSRLREEGEFVDKTPKQPMHGRFPRPNGLDVMFNGLIW